MRGGCYRACVQLDPNHLTFTFSAAISLVAQKRSSIRSLRSHTVRALLPPPPRQSLVVRRNRPYNRLSARYFAGRNGFVAGRADASLTKRDVSTDCPKPSGNLTDITNLGKAYSELWLNWGPVDTSAESSVVAGKPSGSSVARRVAFFTTPARPISRSNAGIQNGV